MVLHWSIVDITNDSYSLTLSAKQANVFLFPVSLPNALLAKGHA